MIPMTTSPSFMTGQKDPMAESLELPLRHLLVMTADWSVLSLLTMGIEKRERCVWLVSNSYLEWDSGVGPYISLVLAYSVSADGQ